MTAMEITGYIGRCKVKGCKHTTRTSEPAFFGKCPDHGAYPVNPIWGVYVENVKCGAKCRNAVGPACDCSCGGHNHGMGYAVAA